MKVILQKDVKNVGKVGDVVTVKDGYARNYLFPRRLAQVAKEKSVKAWEHLKKVAELKKKKALAERKELLNKIASVNVVFKMAAGDTGKLFGAVTAHDVSTELEKHGFSVDRRDLVMEPLKVLGQHKVLVNFGGDLKQEISVSVERQ